ASARCVSHPVLQFMISGPTPGHLARWPNSPDRGIITHSSSGTDRLPHKTIEEPARQIPLYGEYEVAVLGGGPAGIAAAVAAAPGGPAAAPSRESGVHCAPV